MDTPPYENDLKNNAFGTTYLKIRAFMLQGIAPDMRTILKIPMVRCVAGKAGITKNLVRNGGI